MQSWSFGILCYNEEGSLPAVVSSLMQLIGQWAPDQWEIIMVDDGSRDRTPFIIRELAARNSGIVPIFHGENKGIGAGIRSIYFNARYENVVFIPGDGQFDVHELAPYQTFPTNQFICFYREENLTYSTFRNALSWFNKLFNRVLLGMNLRDVNWVKVYKREIIVDLDLRLQSSAIESEICAKLIYLGHQAVEVKSKYLPRHHGVSKGASFKSILRVILELGTLTFAVWGFRFKQTKKRLYD